MQRQTPPPTAGVHPSVAVCSSLPACRVPGEGRSLSCVRSALCLAWAVPSGRTGFFLFQSNSLHSPSAMSTESITMKIVARDLHKAAGRRRQPRPSEPVRDFRRNPARRPGCINFATSVTPSFVHPRSNNHDAMTATATSASITPGLSKNRWYRPLTCADRRQ